MIFKKFRITRKRCVRCGQRAAIAYLGRRGTFQRKAWGYACREHGYILQRELGFRDDYKEYRVS